MIKIFNLLLPVILLVSGQKQCDIDKEFKHIFEEKLKIVMALETGEHPVSRLSYRESLKFLGVVTGIFGKAEIGTTLGYVNPEDYINDVKAWEEWYDTHKCEFTLEMAEHKLEVWENNKD